MEALTLTSDVLEAVVLPQAGARLHRLRAFGRELLRTPDRPEVHLADPFFWGAYVMAPWCNRVQAGPTEFGSRRMDLPSNFTDGSAIHGQVYARPWQTQADGSLSIRGGGDGWPWRYEVRERIRVTDAQLRIELAVANLDDEPMPAGLGIHPWFLRPVSVAIHAQDVLADNLDGAAPPRPVAGRLDLRALGEMPDDLDATWAYPADPAVELAWPGHIRATMRAEAATVFIVGASPSDLDAIAVEPQTHAPHGLARLLAGEQGGLTVLMPGATLSLTASIAFERSTP